jgi:hypothetical protein
MSVPTAYDPKKLADYSFGDRGRMRATGGRSYKYGASKKGGRRRSGVTSGPSRSEIEQRSLAKYKDFVQKDIDAAHKRRAALEGMWKAEKDADIAAKKQAVEDYKAATANAPDPKSDPTGELRAAYMNSPLVQKASAALQAHIAKSMEARKGATPESAKLVVGDTPEGGETVASKFQGYDYRDRIAGRMTERAAARQEPAPTAPTPSPRQRAVNVNAVDKKSGKNITVLGRSKDGKKLRVQDVGTLKTYEVPIGQVEQRKKSRADYDIPV